MTNEEMVAKLNQAIALETEVRDALAGPSPEPPSDIIDVFAGQDLRQVLNDAPAGATLRLTDGTYDSGDVLQISKSVHFITQNTPPEHASPYASVFLTGRGEQTVFITDEASDVSFLGIGFKQQNPDYELALIRGANVLFDRCYGVGDAMNGLRRGWRTEGFKTKFVNCYADNIFRPGRDTCVIGAWQDTNGLEVDRCYLRGGAETIMFGGADSPSSDRVCKNIRITNSTLTKNPDWYAQGAQLKTPLELKSCEHVYVADCVLEYAGVSEGQGAYLLVLTVRNQDGNAPWSRIHDVTIERCHFSKGGGGINFLGHDDMYPSEDLDGVTIKNCAFVEMNPSGLWSQGGYYGSGRCTMFNRAPKNITLDAITMDGVDMAALGYFANTPDQPVGLVMQNWKYCKTEYGWKIDSGGMDVPPASTNILVLMPDLTYNITANDAGAAGYPNAPSVTATQYRSTQSKKKK